MRLPSLIVARTVARTRALFLLLLAIVGPILARDALLLHQIELARDYAIATSRAEARTVAKPPPTAKHRPSGLNKRQTWSPTDPPDDDDETDDDSDTVAVRWVTIEPVPQPVILAPVVVATTPIQQAFVHSPIAIDLLCAHPRGPPRSA